MPLIDVLCYVLSSNATSAPWASELGEAPRDAAANSVNAAPAQGRTSARAQAPQPSRSINASSVSSRPLGWDQGSEAKLILAPRAQTPQTPPAWRIPCASGPRRNPRRFPRYFLLVALDNLVLARGHIWDVHPLVADARHELVILVYSSCYFLL